jgi:hypothetical protein
VEVTGTGSAIAASLVALLLFAASLASAAVCLELAEPAPGIVDLVLPNGGDEGTADGCEDDVLLKASGPKADDIKPQLAPMQPLRNVSHALDDFRIEATRGPPVRNKSPLFLRTGRLRI